MDTKDIKVEEKKEAPVAAHAPIIDPTPTILDNKGATIDTRPDCVACAGEGLLGDPAGQNQLCSNCGGTGKVN